MEDVSLFFFFFLQFQNIWRKEIFLFPRRPTCFRVSTLLVQNCRHNLPCKCIFYEVCESFFFFLSTSPKCQWPWWVSVHCARSVLGAPSKLALYSNPTFVPQTCFSFFWNPFLHMTEKASVIETEVRLWAADGTGPCPASIQGMRGGRQPAPQVRSPFQTQAAALGQLQVRREV